MFACVYIMYIYIYKEQSGGAERFEITWRRTGMTSTMARAKNDDNDHNNDNDNNSDIYIYIYIHTYVNSNSNNDHMYKANWIDFFTLEGEVAEPQVGISCFID